MPPADPTRPDPGPRARPASLARRALPAVALLSAGGALFSMLDHPAGTDLAGATAGAATTGATPTAATPATTPSTSAATTPTTSATSGSSTGSGSSPATTCSGASATGSSVTTKYGPVQVKVTLDATGKVCDVTALSYPSSDARSASINARAIPTLRTSAISANSASFNGVSGATYTSTAYEQSLQSALDALR